MYTLLKRLRQSVRYLVGAACKIAHSQELSRTVTEQELDREYRSEQALTVGLMGLLAKGERYCPAGWAAG